MRRLQAQRSNNAGRVDIEEETRRDEEMRRGSSSQAGYIKDAPADGPSWVLPHACAQDPRTLQPSPAQYRARLTLGPITAPCPSAIPSTSSPPPQHPRQTCIR